MKAIVILDFDRCTHTVKARQQLTEKLINFLDQRPDIDQLDVMIGSARSLNFCMDFRGSYENSLRGVSHMSCSVLGDEFVENLTKAVNAHFGEARKIKVEFDPLLLGDVLNCLRTGTSYELMQENRDFYAEWSTGKKSVAINKDQRTHILIRPKLTIDANQPKNVIDFISNSLECFDEYKILLLYLITQYKMQKSSSEENLFLFFDDRADILQAVDQFFRDNAEHLLPLGSSLCVFQFVAPGYQCNQIFSSPENLKIIGQGQINQNFESSVRKIALRHNSYVEESHKDFESEKEIYESLYDIIIDMHQKAISPMVVCKGLTFTDLPDISRAVTESGVEEQLKKRLKLNN